MGSQSRYMGTAIRADERDVKFVYYWAVQGRLLGAAAKEGSRDLWTV
jgi:hypothetical protein